MTNLYMFFWKNLDYCGDDCDLNFDFGNVCLCDQAVVLCLLKRKTSGPIGKQKTQKRTPTPDAKPTQRMPRRPSTQFKHTERTAKRLITETVARYITP